MHHRTLLIALITMVCSDPTDSNAFVGDSNRKFEALQPPGTRCAGRYPVQMYGLRPVIVIVIVVVEGMLS